MASARDFIEALEESLDTSTDWWEQFDTKEEALEAISHAERTAERLSDEHIIALLAAITEETVEEDNMLKIFYSYINMLKNQLLEIF